MAYQVLARKWRPQTFEEVVGQEPITRTLQNALAAGRVAHAFCLQRPPGRGQDLGGPHPGQGPELRPRPHPPPRNTCQVCREITNGSSLDVLEIDGASNRGIDEVRDLREKIKYLPAQGKYRVYIIDEVHMLTKEAFNALLKTLEEPPAHAVFILATTEPHKVPVTILSRCQRYDFRRIPTGLIQAHLAKLAEQEGWNVDPEGLALVARAAEGGLRDAQGFLDQVVTFGGEAVSAAEIARILGVTDRGALLKAWRPSSTAGTARICWTLVEELYNQGHDLQRFYQDLVLYARHLLLAGLYPEARSLAPVADSEWEELAPPGPADPGGAPAQPAQRALQGEEELKKGAPAPVGPGGAAPQAHSPGAHAAPGRRWLSRLENLEARLESAGRASASPGDQSRARSPPAAARPQPRPGAGRAPGRGASLRRAPTWTRSGRPFSTTLRRRKAGPCTASSPNCRLLGLDDHRLKIAPGRTWNAVGPSHEARLQELAQAVFRPPVFPGNRSAGARARRQEGTPPRPESPWTWRSCSSRPWKSSAAPGRPPGLGRRNPSEEHDVHDEAGPEAPGQDGGDAGRTGQPHRQRPGRRRHGGGGGQRPPGTAEPAHRPGSGESPKTWRCSRI